jgi:ketosteroid isomerase-like protein
MKQSEQVARTYVAASNRCDYEAMSDLFHEDAEWIPIAPTQPRRGRAEIRERYLTEVRPTNAPIINDRYIADDRRCAVEFDVDHPQHGLVAVVDVFTVNQHGEITRLAVYRR